MALIPESILLKYNLQKEAFIQQIGSGFINRTFLVYNPLYTENQFILQEVNSTVFKNPYDIANNVDLISKFLHHHYPNYLFPSYIPNIDGQLITEENGIYWRMSHYMQESIAYNTLSNPNQAFQAAAQFGKLTRLLDKFPIDQLVYTIPDFHNLEFRLNQFKDACLKAPTNKIEDAIDTINLANNYEYISNYYNSYLKSPDFKNRVIHHDTKISNVLLNKHDDSGICVIDLDTLMPGKFTSDLGDMMRTYLCAFSENEADLSKINIRIPYFESMIRGYLSETSQILTKTELELLLFSGKYIVYMQAIRFLTDHLNGDIYYKIEYPNQNLNRAKNQFKLLNELIKNEVLLQDIIDKAIKEYRK